MSHKHHHHHHGPEDFDERFEPGPRTRGRPPFGRGGPFGPGAFFGAGPFGGGRGRARRGDVRAALLSLLAEEPRNGYQLMQAIEERSGGRWRPSPGSVYPALAQLEDQGFVRATERDGTKLFEVTDEGRAHLEETPAHTPPWETEDGPGSEQFTELRSLIAQTAQAAWQVAQVADERQIEQAAKLLTETRRGLYRILADEPQE